MIDVPLTNLGKQVGASLPLMDLSGLHVMLSAGTALEKMALKQIDLQILQGDFVLVLGGNGAGKSTLLNLIAGELKPQEGTIHIDGNNITRFETHQRSQWISRVFQDPLVGTCGELTIAENMMLASRGVGKRKFIRNEFKLHLAALGLGLEDRLDTPMMLLSGGQRQAVSILMATMRSPRLLLLDEPTAALDTKTAEMVLKIIQKRVAEDNLTALMVTHNADEKLQLGNRMVTMDDGRIVADVRR